MITSNAKEKIEEFNSIGLHYNLVEERDFLETHRRTNLEPGDVLFTNTGTIGRMAIAPDDPRTYRTTFQKSVAILKPKRNLIEPRFLYYLLHFDNSRLSDFAAGTTQKNLLLKDFRSFAVQIPSIAEQRAIAQILGALDDKIELNRRMIPSNWSVKHPSS